VVPGRRRLGFLCGGDIWTIDAAGGAPRRLTSGQEDERMVRWSPDRRFVAFVSNRSTWEHDDLWIVPVDGGEARQVTKGVRVMSQPVWAADGRTVAFNAVENGEYWYGDMSDIYRRRRRGWRDAKGQDAGGGVGPQRRAADFLTADGATAYFVFLQRGDANLWAVPTSGGVATQLTDVGGNIQGIAFSPAAQAFAFVHSMPTQSGVLKVVPIAGGEPRALAAIAARFAQR
jgi:Tol biopolymer transport system component